MAISGSTVVVLSSSDPSVTYFYNCSTPSCTQMNATASASDFVQDIAFSNGLLVMGARDINGVNGYRVFACNASSCGSGPITTLTLSGQTSLGYGAVSSEGLVAAIFQNAGEGNVTFSSCTTSGCVVLLE